MIEPKGLLLVARLLIDDKAESPSNEQLRRAVSTAYYAPFYHVAERVAERAATRFMGHDRIKGGGYKLIYRSFEHKQIKDVCKKLASSSLHETIRRQLGWDFVSHEMKNFATEFVQIQEARHAADYDPETGFERAEVADRIDGVENAIAAFDRAPSREQEDVLALMMVKPRG